MKNFFIYLYRVIGSSLFSVCFMTFTVFYSFFCLLCFRLPYRLRYNILRFWMRTVLLMLKIFCGIRYHVRGLENIPTYSCVILSKHQSTWETFALPCIFPQPAIVLKKELLGMPFFGWGLRLMDPIAIDRYQKASAMEQILEQGSARLKKGQSVLIFPEGTRIEPGKTARYRIGGILLAVKAGDYPIIPVAHNAGEYWPRGGFLKKPGIIHLTIGEPIATKGRDLEEILVQVRNWIETTLINFDRG